MGEGGEPWCLGIGTGVPPGNSPRGLMLVGPAGFLCCEQCQRALSGCGGSSVGRKSQPWALPMQRSASLPCSAIPGCSQHMHLWLPLNPLLQRPQGLFRPVPRSVTGRMVVDTAHGSSFRQTGWASFKEVVEPATHLALELTLSPCTVPLACSCHTCTPCHVWA